MADPTPTPREHALAAELDAKLLAIESKFLGAERHGEANRKMLAEALASYRAEVMASIIDLKVCLSSDGRGVTLAVGNTNLATIDPDEAMKFAMVMTHVALVARGKGG